MMDFILLSFSLVLTMDIKEVGTEYYAFDSLNWHFKYWKFLGVTTEEFPKRYQLILYRFFTALIHFGVQIYLPFHLIYGLFQLSNPRDILENFAMGFTLIICSMKVYILQGALDALKDIKEISNTFEKKAKQNKGEYTFILEFKSKSKIFMKLYFISFTILAVSTALSILTYGSRRLLYPGYFPFDFKQNRFVYALTAFYQWLAWTIQDYANVHHDTYPGLMIFLLCQHLKILNLRISRIGYDNECSDELHHRLLKEAVEDHRQILRFHRKINDATSMTSFALFLSSSFNMVTCLILFIFFADHIFQKFYLAQLLFCYALETALSCYYGSEFDANIFKITESLYKCNWYEQTGRFKQDFIIFLECSLRKYKIVAGGLLPVNKDTFARIIKGVFSLFTVLNSMRQKF